MSLIVSVHSFRGGTGKSNIAASLGAVMAQQGKRVAIVDTDIQSPGIHVLFGFDASSIGRSINDYLHGECQMMDVVHDITEKIGAGAAGGQLLLIPASIKATDITRVLREGYDVGLLNSGFQTLIDELALDVLLVDTHPGLNEETLVSLTLSDVLLLVLRPDQQDFQGTAVTVDIARRLEVPSLLLAINKIPSLMSLEDVRAKVAATYGAEVGAVMPLSEEMAMNASSHPFALSEPLHVWSQQLRAMAGRILEEI
jgi:MinD-like ATPase involved in chromosome partitioning or flagellar assembly